MSVFVIVDDSDPNIQYQPTVPHTPGEYTNSSSEAGGWFVAGLGEVPEFLVTTSGSGNASSSMRFEFNGTSISVFSSIAGGDRDAYVGTNVSFSIDGSIVSTNTYSVPSDHRTHVPIFVSPTLSPSTHVLEMEILSSAPRGNISNIFFDYLIYNATVNSSMPSPSAQTSWLFVDDQSEWLEYSGDPNGWDTTVANFPETQTFNLTDATFNSTVMGPTSSASTVSLNFTGASMIQAYGMLTSVTGLSLGTYTFDNTSRSLNAPPIGYTNPTLNFMLLNVTIPQAQTGDYHTLEIQAGSAGAFYLDYLLLNSGSAFVRNDISNPNLGSNSTADGSSRTKGTDVGAIAGGVVGGVVALAVVGLAILLWLRRGRNTDGDSSGPYHEDRYATFGDGGVVDGQEHGVPTEMRQGDITPFLATSTSNTRITPTKNPIHRESTPIDSQSRKLEDYNPYDTTQTHTPTFSQASGSDSPFTTTRQGDPSGPPGLAAPAPVMESDSGLRGFGEEVATLPPRYTPD